VKFKPPAALVLLALAALLMTPALLWGPGPIDSAILNYGWTKQFALELGRGQLYPRWLPSSFEGLGSPTFFFYPPLVFYCTGLLDLVGLTTLQAVNVAAFGFLFLSGAAMHLWLRGKTPHALLGACLYMAAPYHLNDFYDRAALAEFAAYAWLPLIALAIEGQPRRWAGPLLAVAFAGLIATHLPVALLASLLLIAPLVGFTAWRRRSVGQLARCAAAGAAGLGLAMVYLLPALSLQQHVTIRLLSGPYFQPQNWSVLWPAGGIKTTLLYAYGALAAAAAILALGALRRGARFWPLLACCVAGLSLGLLPVLWMLPLLRNVQFPWRCLVIVEFATVSALCMAPLRCGAAALAALVAAPSVVLLAGVAQVGLRNPYPRDLDVAMADAAEYLPPAAVPPEVKKLVGRPPLERFRGPLIQGPAHQVAAGEGGELLLFADTAGVVTVRRTAFPIWRVVREGEAVGLLPGPLLSFPVQPGAYRVERIALDEEQLGGWISLASLPLLLALFGRRTLQRPGGQPIRS
jgi:hypothetical protein